MKKNIFIDLIRKLGKKLIFPNLNRLNKYNLISKRIHSFKEIAQWYSIKNRRKKKFYGRNKIYRVTIFFKIYSKD